LLFPSKVNVTYSLLNDCWCSCWEFQYYNFEDQIISDWSLF